ncbi:hypothetical protein [Luteimonas sp. FCS-9]|uniref:hypothetical protein n=1 Tax=Luteimonas sp. FCS-9 TaxID=1547516 RepID=UPI00069BE325|nr:hypothetical protein [Luteimonas sp. FCS-9]
MRQLRVRLPLGLAIAGALAPAACGDRQADDAPAQTEPVEDTRTVPSEAAAAQLDDGTAPVEAPLSGDAATTMLTQLAGLGGAMHAAVELCDPNIPADQLAQAKDRQQQEFVKMGGDAAMFDREFASAHDKVRAQYDTATPAQQQQMCAELESMASSAPAPATE